MALKSHELFEQCLTYLSVLRYIFKSRTKRGDYTLNKKAEPFFRDLVNIVYGWDLEDMNQIQENYPAIDLGDEGNRVCIQVTAQNDSTKINKTIKKFINHDLYESYDRLIFLILTEKKSYSFTPNTKDKIEFDIDDDIWDVDNLLEVIELLDVEKIEKVHRFVSKELSTIVNVFAKKDSLLSRITEVDGVKPDQSNLFIKDLALEPEDAIDAREYIQRFYELLKKLTPTSREYLFVIMLKGNVYSNSHFDNIAALPAEIESTLHLSRSESNEQYEILASYDDLAYFESEDYPPRIEVRFNFIHDLDLIYLLHQFCVNDSDMLEKIVVDCDFSFLETR